MIKHRIELNQLIDLKAPVAEIGVAEGYFSAEILRWGVPYLYMVDNYGTISNQFGDGANPQEWHDRNMNQALARAAQYSTATVELLRGISWDMAGKVRNGHLGLLYLDGCHTYECVKKDLEAWVPKVKDGGYVAGHDFLNKAYGVNQAVHDFCRQHGYTVNTIPENKDEDAGFWFLKDK